MAHRSQAMWWQCLEIKWKGKLLGFRWILYLGHPDDEGCQCLFELPDEEYRSVIKGLPKAEHGLIFAARMTCVPCRAPKRGKLAPLTLRQQFEKEE